MPWCSTTSIGKEHLCEVTCRHTIYLTQRSGPVHLLASLCVSDSRPPISPSVNNRTGRFISNPYSPEVECPHAATTYLSRGPDLLLQSPSSRTSSPPFGSPLDLSLASIRPNIESVPSTASLSASRAMSRCQRVGMEAQVRPDCLPSFSCTHSSVPRHQVDSRRARSAADDA